MAIESTEPQTLKRVKGNTEPIGATIRDNAGNAIDLSGKTMAFRMVLKSDGSVKVDNESATPDPDQVTNKGKVAYSPDSGDVDTEGEYAGYFIDTGSSPNVRWPHDGAVWTIDIVAENRT